MLRLTYSILLFLCVCFESGKCCPDNWMTFQGSCYYFHYMELSFTEAQHACLHLNSNLVQIDSADESRFIKNTLSHQAPAAYWWLGLSDDDIEGTWKWEGSGDRATYTDWYPGEPDSRGDEDCVTAEGHRSFMWIDNPCTWLCYSICELRDSTSEAIIVG